LLVCAHKTLVLNDSVDNATSVQRQCFQSQMLVIQTLKALRIIFMQVFVSTLECTDAV
jgi:hypothetical protein